MQITMFKGLLPVNLPDSWFTNPEAIRFAKVGIAQAIDFRPNGGKALKFWVTYDPVTQHWEEIQGNCDGNCDWSDEPFAIESRKTVQMFGQSKTVLDLKQHFEK